MAKISGGEKVEAYFRDLSKKLDAGVLRVGFLEGATYPPRVTIKQPTKGKAKRRTKVGGQAQPLTVAAVAAFNEYGVPSRGQPPRPFFRNMIAEKGPSWPKAVAKLLKANNYDGDKTLRMTGEAIKGQLQQSIIKLVSPPLSPRTVKAKGSSKPLIDTGHMLNSVDYEVVSK